MQFAALDVGAPKFAYIHEVGCLAVKSLEPHHRKSLLIIFIDCPSQPDLPLLYSRVRWAEDARLRYPR